MRELLQEMPIRCHWPGQLIERHAIPHYRDAGFVAVVEDSSHVPGYRQVFWAAADVQSAVSGLRNLVRGLPGKLHTTVNGQLDFVEPLIDMLKQHRFELRDLHAEMVARPLNDQPPSPHVEPASEDDLSQVAELLSHTFAGYGVPTQKELQELVSTAQKALFVSRDSGEVVGATDGEIYGEALDHLFVHSVAVHPDHRRKGLGRALVQTLINWGVRQGAMKSMLWLSDVHNVAAKDLYLSLGFLDTGDREAELTRDE